MSRAAEACEQCDRIIELCGDLPDEAEEFSESVVEKCKSMRDWIEENGRVTDRQQEALDNMEAGANRWLERDE